MMFFQESIKTKDSQLGDIERYRKRQKDWDQ